jgi:hypothetical protein
LSAISIANASISLTPDFSFPMSSIFCQMTVALCFLMSDIF